MTAFVEGALVARDTLSYADCVLQTPFLPFDIHLYALQVPFSGFKHLISFFFLLGLSPFI
jgi:hypothetical protein